MNRFRTYRIFGALAAVLLAFGAASGCKKAPSPPATPPKPVVAGAKTNAPVAATNDLTAFVSQFQTNLPSGKARDPFFPDSTRPYGDQPPPTEQVAAPTAPVAPTLVLRGVAGRPGSYLATINNQILEVGEDSAVRPLNSSVKVNIHVVEIGEDYVVIQVRGEASQKRLTLGHQE